MRRALPESCGAEDRRLWWACWSTTTSGTVAASGTLESYTLTMCTQLPPFEGHVSFPVSGQSSLQGHYLLSQSRQCYHRPQPWGAANTLQHREDAPSSSW